MLKLKINMPKILILVFAVISNSIYCMQQEYPLDMLYNGIKKNDIELVKKIIKSGVNVNERRCHKLLVLACDKLRVEIVDLLLEANADVNSSDWVGRPCLSFAVFHRGLYNAGDKGERIIDKLLRAGANPNKSDMQGTTPLMIYMKNPGDKFTLLCLLNAGADLMIRGDEGNSLDIAKRQLTTESGKKWLKDFLDEYKRVITKEIDKHLPNVLTSIVYDYVCME